MRRFPLVLGLWMLFLHLAEGNDGLFSGRVSRINEAASLIRILIKFENMKFLNKKDQLEFWSGIQKGRRCAAYVVGKSNEYLLVRVPHIQHCLRRVQVTVGAYLTIYSQDLANNISVAKDLVEILVKKRLAINAKLEKERRELSKYIEKVEAVNKRYQVLRSKLELEWQEELGHVQNDKANTLRNFKAMEIRLSEIDHKLQQYRVQDSNLEMDRWSLDSRLYFRK